MKPYHAGITGDLDDDVEYLVDLDYDSFEKLVVRNLVPQAETMIWDALTDPDVLQRTRDVLAGITPRMRERSTDAKLSEPDRRHAAFMYRALSERSRQCKHIARQIAMELQREAAGRNQREERTNRLRKMQEQLSITLTLAIERHRRATSDASTADLALWSLLDSEFWPHDDTVDTPMTIAELLDHGHLADRMGGPS